MVAGFTMPTTGYVKLRRKVANIADNDVLTFANGATATVNSATGGQRGWITFSGPKIQNFAITHRSSVTQFLGDWFEIGTCNGSAGQKIKDAQFEISSTSTVAIGAVKIANAGVVIVDTSVMTAAGGLDAVGNVNIVDTSALNIQYNRIVHFGAVLNDTSSVVINARKKWETESDVSEAWTTVSV